MSATSNGFLHIVYLGETGFPFGLAPIQRQLLISRGLVEAGAHVLVVSNKGVFPPTRKTPLDPMGTYKGINYIYTSGNIYRPDNFIHRNLLKIKGIIRELLLLIRLKNTNKLDSVIVATMRFQIIFYYYLLSRILRFRVLLNYVEQNSAISTRVKWRDKINDWFLDKWGLCCADAILPISHYLDENVHRICPGKPTLKIPILGDFNSPQDHQPSQSSYLLYCGSANYLELIDFIIRSFELVDHSESLLYLVVNGDPKDMEHLNNRVLSSSVKKRIKLYSSLSLGELQTIYREATGLLIPLRPTIQDQARFPHKIGEYLASGAPMITTRVGEVGHYFKDGENAVVSEKYDPIEYAKKMEFVLKNPDTGRRIGQQGQRLGTLLFDYKKHGETLLNFIKKIK